MLSSPRSVEACKRQGIQAGELVYQGLEDFRKALGLEGQQLHRDQVHMRWQHLEQRRKEKIAVIKEEREIVILEEVNGQWAPGHNNASLTSKSGSPSKGSAGVGISTQMGGMRTSGHSTSSPSKLAKTAQAGFSLAPAQLDSAMLEKEKQALQRIKQKQQRELEQMLGHERQLQEIREKNERKMQADREKEEARLREVAAKQREQERRKLEEEERKRIAAEKEAEAVRQRQIEQVKREREKAEQAAQAAKLKQEEAREREEE